MRQSHKVYSCGTAHETKSSLRQWFRSPVGRELLGQEKALLDQVLPTLFGYHLLQVGRPASEDLTAASRIGHQLLLDESPQAHALGGIPRVLVGDGGALPIASDSLDVILLPHTLEFHDAPHQILREVDRTLIPEGHVLIFGFNPLSLCGLRRLLANRGQAPWCGQFYTVNRLRDWLTLLGFDTVLTRSYFFRPPLQYPRLLARLKFIEAWGSRWWPVLGGGYLLVARKRVATLTPIRPRWRPRRIMAGSVIKPSLRKINERTE